MQRNKAAVRIQAAVRGHLTRSSFRKATELGKRQAARAALNAKRAAAAVTIQKHARRRMASKKVQGPSLCVSQSSCALTCRIHQHL